MGIRLSKQKGMKGKMTESMKEARTPDSAFPARCAVWGGEGKLALPQTDRPAVLPVRDR
jgi:hypothetical protein